MTKLTKLGNNNSWEVAGAGALACLRGGEGHHPIACWLCGCLSGVTNHGPPAPWSSTAHALAQHQFSHVTNFWKQGRQACFQLQALPVVLKAELNLTFHLHHISEVIPPRWANNSVFKYILIVWTEYVRMPRQEEPGARGVVGGAAVGGEGICENLEDPATFLVSSLFLLSNFESRSQKLHF